MKQYIIPFIPLLLLVTHVFGQSTEQLPNNGFENWVQRSSQIYVEPENWYSLNMLKKYGYPASTIKTTDAHSGQAAVRLETQNGPGSAIPGLLCSAYMFDANENPDFDKNRVPFHSRPLSISFWYKCTQVSTDTNVFLMLLTKWNPVKENYDTIGDARWRAQQTVSTYTKATCTFNYYSGAIPDSASVIFSTTIFPFNPAIGNVLIVDDITLAYPAVSTGPQIPENTLVNIYPNPVSSKLNVEAPEEITEAYITDMMGQQLTSIAPAASSFGIDCSDLNSGVYLLHLRHRSGYVQTKRFSK